jgi:hypothetical protein
LPKRSQRSRARMLTGGLPMRDIVLLPTEYRCEKPP